MLEDFEIRLADVLGTRLAAPLSGAVDVTPGTDQSRIVVGVSSVQRVENDLLSLRPERVPGDSSPRRVLKLHCSVDIGVKAPAAGGRTDQMLAIDQVLYLLEDSSMRDGSALLPGDNSDPGFLITRMTVSGSTPPQAIALEAEGFFWPIGTPGQQGPEILQTRIREALRPLLLDPQPSHLVAGGPGVDFSISFGASGTTIVSSGGVQNDAFGSLVVSVADAGGRPGKGTLSGGVAGPGGARAFAVSDGSASLRYTPPPQPATDFLVVALDDGAGGTGIELGRFQLRVRSS